MPAYYLSRAIEIYCALEVPQLPQQQNTSLTPTPNFAKAVIFCSLAFFDSQHENFLSQKIQSTNSSETEFC